MDRALGENAATTIRGLDNLSKQIQGDIVVALLAPLMYILHHESS
jgi:hypothetical protein